MVLLTYNHSTLDTKVGELQVQASYIVKCCLKQLQLFQTFFVFCLENIKYKAVLKF